jgi:hypothetical protein
MTVIKRHSGFAHEKERLTHLFVLYLAKTRAHYLHHLGGSVIEDVLASTL